MAFGETTTQMIFFITAVTVATALVFTLNTNIQSFTKSLNFKAKTVSSQVSTSIKILNDPCYINRTIFVKNIGSTELNPAAVDVLINGVFNSPPNENRFIFNPSDSTYININEETLWKSGKILALNYTSALPLDSKINKIRVITENGAFDELAYSNATC